MLSWFMEDDTADSAVRQGAVLSPQVTSSGELQRLPNWTVMCASTVCHHKWHQAESYNDCRIGQ